MSPAPEAQLLGVPQGPARARCHGGDRLPASAGGIRCLENSVQEEEQGFVGWASLFQPSLRRC